MPGLAGPEGQGEGPECLPGIVEDVNADLAALIGVVDHADEALGAPI